MKKSILLSLFFIAAIVLSAQRTKEPVIIELFHDTPILFNPTDYPNGVVEREGLTYLGNWTSRQTGPLTPLTTPLGTSSSLGSFRERVTSPPWS